MKNKILCLLLALSLCGCQSLPESPVGAQPEVKELTLAIPKGSNELLKEVSRELSRRAVDFAENSLTIEIVEKENIWEALEDGSADLVVCENSRLLDDAEKLGELVYPEVFVLEELSEEELQLLPEPVLEGPASMLAMLDYPYFFRDADCIIGGGNDAAVLAALNYSLPEDFGMELKRLTYGGVYHWMTNDWETLETYLLEYSPSQMINALMEQGEPLRNLWGRLPDGEVYIREVDLSSTNADLSDKTLLLSGERRKLIGIYSNPETMAELSPIEQAAVEEAIVYSGGYSRTLADDQQETIMRQLEEQNISMVEVNINEWYAAFQKLYRSGNCEVNSDLADLLWDKTERFH